MWHITINLLSQLPIQVAVASSNGQFNGHEWNDRELFHSDNDNASMQGGGRVGKDQD